MGLKKLLGTLAAKILYLNKISIPSNLKIPIMMNLRFKITVFLKIIKTNQVKLFKYKNKKVKNISSALKLKKQK